MNETIRRNGTVTNPSYLTDKYGKLLVTLIPREFENSIQEEIIELREEVVSLTEVLDPVAATKVRQLQTLSMTPNTIYSTSSGSINGGAKLSSLDNCLKVSFLLRHTTGSLRISPNNSTSEPYYLRPAGFLQTFLAPQLSEYYLTYIPEDPLDITPRVLEIDYIFSLEG